MRRGIWLLAAMIVLVLPVQAQGAFPGANGRIAYDSFPTEICCNRGISTMDPDGSDAVLLTDYSESDNSDPAWSPDGTKIAFAQDRDAGIPQIWVMNADGSNPVRVTNSQPRSDSQPHWSPDGSKLVFSGRTGFDPADVYVIDADGSDEVNLTSSASRNDEYPAWSPDGERIVFSSMRTDLDQSGLLTMNPDGSQVTPVTQTDDTDLYPNWSPDGQRIVFNRHNSGGGDLYLVDADGSNLEQLTNDPDPSSSPAWSPQGDRIAFENNATGPRLHLVDPDGTNEIDVTPPDQPGAAKPDWQPIPINSYPRPKGATPFRASLTTAYQPCAAPDRQHGPPLAFPSCSGPDQTSAHLTVGTGDSNGLPARNEGNLLMRVRPGLPSTPAIDEADVELDFFLDDVFTSALADYSGELRARVPLQITDKDNTPHPGGPGAATTVEIPLELVVGCTPVADPQEGSACAATTSADALAPGTVKESRRSIWQLGRVEVYDGGADGDAHTPAGDTLFATQGIFIP